MEQTVDISLDFDADDLQIGEFGGLVFDCSAQLATGHADNRILFTQGAKSGVCCASIIARNAGSLNFKRDLPILSRFIMAPPDLALPHLNYRMFP